MPIRFHNCRLLRHREIIHGELWVDGGKIISPGESASQSIDLGGRLVVPGLIDLQLNGAFGCDFTSAPERLSEVSTLLGQFGVTSFLAAVVSSSKTQYRSVIPVLQAQIGNACQVELLGIHLEGPCFNTQQAKAHAFERIRSCSDFASPEDCYGGMHGVKIVTLAPELPGALEWIEWLNSHGIIPSAGHSMASAKQMDEAINAGLGMATHLFNGMAPLHHRSPGLIGSILTHPGFFYSVIADGRHVDPLMLQIAWKCQPEGLILISDAISALGLPHGHYPLGDKIVEVDAWGARLAGSDVLAGGVASLDQMMRNFQRYAGTTLVESILAVTEKPAKAIGVYPRKGILDVGSDADFVVLDDRQNIFACYARGEQIYRSKETRDSSDKSACRCP